MKPEDLQELIKFHTRGERTCRAYSNTPDAQKDETKHYNKRADWHASAIETLNRFATLAGSASECTAKAGEVASVGETVSKEACDHIHGMGMALNHEEGQAYIRVPIKSHMAMCFDPADWIIAYRHCPVCGDKLPAAPSDEIAYLE